MDRRTVGERKIQQCSWTKRQQGKVQERCVIKDPQNSAGSLRSLGHHGATHTHTHTQLKRKMLQASRNKRLSAVENIESEIKVMCFNSVAIFITLKMSNVHYHINIYHHIFRTITFGAEQSLFLTSIFVIFQLKYLTILN